MKYWIWMLIIFFVMESICAQPHQLLPCTEESTTSLAAIATACTIIKHSTPPGNTLQEIHPIMQTGGYAFFTGQMKSILLDVSTSQI